MTDPRYFAVPDPDDAGRITYWRRDRTGRLKPWPAKARYGPVLWRKSAPGRRHVIPAGLDHEQKRAWMGKWIRTVSGPWYAKVYAAIDADPAGAGARFAVLECACAICGRALTDPASRTYGVGPECRSDWPDVMLAAAVEAVGRAHAALLAEGHLLTEKAG